MTRKGTAVIANSKPPRVLFALSITAEQVRQRADFRWTLNHVWTAFKHGV